METLTDVPMAPPVPAGRPEATSAEAALENITRAPLEPASSYLDSRGSLHDGAQVLASSSGVSSSSLGPSPSGPCGNVDLRHYGSGGGGEGADPGSVGGGGGTLGTVPAAPPPPLAGHLDGSQAAAMHFTPASDPVSGGPGLQACGEGVWRRSASITAYKHYRAQQPPLIGATAS